MLRELVGERVTLRALDQRYINDYLAMFSPQVQSLLHVYDKQTESSYLQSCLTYLQQKLTLFYCVFDAQQQQLIGAIEIRHFSENRGQLYNWLHEDYWGGGRYQEALTLISNEYFRLFNTCYFNAHVDVTNERSYRALQKFGCAHAGFCNGAYGRQYKLVIRKRA